MKMNVRSLIVGACAVLCVIFSSCNEGPDVPNQYEQLQNEIAVIDSDLAALGISPVKDPSGIRMIITKLGTGLPAQINNTVNVDYVGRRYSDKVVFDQGNVNSKLSNYIDGWKVAFTTLPEGSEATLIIPSLYGYGSAGYGSSIPGNTILEFDVKFKDVILSSSDLQLLGSDTTAIDAYLDGKGIEAVKDSTGLRYVITTPGVGPSPSWYNKLTMKYTIKLLSDDTKPVVTVEQQPTEDFYSRTVDYIHGMKVGLQKLSIGSKAVFYIPSVYAFGASGVTDSNTGAYIPPNANIIVDVEVVDID